MEPTPNPFKPSRLAPVLQPVDAFLAAESAGGVVLMLSALAALVWANSPWGDSYQHFWHTQLSVSLAGHAHAMSLEHWVSDGLMVVFFLLVGLEIKRELLIGELASPRRAALPIAGAIGGMAVPALIYLAFNAGGPGRAGWGVPMATDIAFALGVLALLGNRVPAALKVFLAAFAIADDIGAVLVIALFYTAKIHFAALVVGFGFLVLAALANWSGIRRPLVYVLLGLVIWVAFLESGVHATVAGVLLAMTIPASARLDPAPFLARSRNVLDRFEQANRPSNILTNAERQAALHTLENAAEQAQTPLLRLEHALHPWVSFFIMPVFALANAGVPLGGAGGAGITSSVPLGIIAGLVLGKPLGVTLFAWLAVRSGLAAKPQGVTWAHLHGAGWLGGIGFTMALFIAGLAFADPASLAAAKLGILSASLIAGVIGFVLLRRSSNGTLQEMA